MKNEIERLLPLIQTGQIPKHEAEQLLNTISKAIKADPSKGKELGRYISLISNALKLQQLETNINWVPVANGYLAIGHKPGGKISFEGLKKEGASVIVTLLHENEGALQIGTQTQQAGIDWIWFPFSASKPHEQYDTIKVLQLYNQLQLLLKSGGNIYIHCSAGIHRTGMVTYGLLRYLGYRKIDALQMLRALREVTAAQVGENRLQWGDRYATKMELHGAADSLTGDNEEIPVDYFSYDTDTWPYLSKDDYLIYAYFQIWEQSLPALFPVHDFLLCENRGIPNYHYNFFSLVVREKGAETSDSAIVFMINKNVPLAVWGTVTFKASGWDDEWYIPAHNLFINSLAESFNPLIEYMVTGLTNANLNFTPRAVLLDKHKLPPEEMKHLCINLDGSLDTVYGCTYNVYDGMIK
jgi:hypothetical protein